MFSGAKFPTPLPAKYTLDDVLHAWDDHDSVWNPFGAATDATLLRNAWLTNAALALVMRDSRMTRAIQETPLVRRTTRARERTLDSCYMFIAATELLPLKRCASGTNFVQASSESFLMHANTTLDSEKKATHPVFVYVPNNGSINELISHIHRRELQYGQALVPDRLLTRMTLSLNDIARKVQSGKLLSIKYLRCITYPFLLFHWVRELSTGSIMCGIIEPYRSMNAYCTMFSKVIQAQIQLAVDAHRLYIGSTLAETPCWLAVAACAIQHYGRDASSVASNNDMKLFMQAVGFTPSQAYVTCEWIDPDVVNGRQEVYACAVFLLRLFDRLNENALFSEMRFSLDVCFKYLAKKLLQQSKSELGQFGARLAEVEHEVIKRARYPHSLWNEQFDDLISDLELASLV